MRIALWKCDRCQTTIERKDPSKKGRRDDEFDDGGEYVYQASRAKMEAGFPVDWSKVYVTSAVPGKKTSTSVQIHLCGRCTRDHAAWLAMGAEK